MTTVGLRWTKFASGSAAISMAPTATTTAIIITGTCGVMPTAVMMLSIEKTRSRARIWAITDAKPLVATRPPSAAGRFSGSTR